MYLRFLWQPEFRRSVGSEADPSNFLLMHAMGPNVAGVIGTAVAAGTFMAMFGVM